MPLENNHPHSLDFRPILLPGQKAQLIRGQSTNFVNIEVVHVYPLGVHRHDFGTLTGNTLDQDDTHLDMPSGEMAQYRFIPRGTFRVHLQHPGGTDIYRTNGSVKGVQREGFFIDPYDENDNPWDGHDTTLWAASEFFVFEDETPRFDLYPLAPAAAARDGYVDFYGWAFVLKRTTDKPPVTLWVNGRPRGEALTPVA